MTSPCKIAGWEFFNGNVGKADDVGAVVFEQLGDDDRTAAELFINALSGRRRVIDIGCGGGFPGLHVAAHVGEIIGVDAAPNVVSAGQANLRSLGVQNMSIAHAAAESLPFADAEFDGAMLCGVLESMDWESVPRAISEARRVLAPGGRIAVLDQDWAEVISRKPACETQIRFEDGRLTYFTVERHLSPHRERCTWYVIDPGSASGIKLRAELGERKRVPASLGLGDIDDSAALDAWYDETAQFDVDTLIELVASNGFGDVRARSLPIWGQKIVFATAVKLESEDLLDSDLRVSRRDRPGDI